MEIYIVRHGTTTWNREKRIQGRTDIDLDDRGIRMAEETSRALKDMGLSFDLVYSSPLKRAVETAKILSPGSGVIADERLIELSFGKYEGEKTHLLPYFGREPARYNEEAPSYGAESLAELLDRTSGFMKDKIEPLAGSDLKVMISGHGAMNRCLLMYIRGTSDFSEFWGSGLQSNCGITKVIAGITPNGSVRYEMQGECRTYYDESLRIDPASLLKE
ncbi:MAG: histidine phosphatase family protein [Clostridiales bacterium]|nr:histidine phosphatase family protein [Clostridiales bacterium]